MKTNKILTALCCLFALISAVFVFLSATKQKTEQESGPDNAIFSAAPGTSFSPLSEDTGKIVSNSVKKASFPNGILEKLKQAYAINGNLAGWLTIPGTEMDTAVLQAEDNAKYLTKDFYERVTSEISATNYGNIYLDYRCLKDGNLSKNMVIHGHTTGRSDGIPKQAFRSLYDYRNPDHFKKCPIIKYSTLYGEYTYKICAVFYSTASAASDNGYMFNYIYPDMSDTNMVGYINQVKERMLYETGVSLDPTDKIITLSTCIYDYGKSVDTRLVVVGRLLHESEDETIDTSLVKNNPDYRRPQIWYTANGKSNPYADSEQWEPSPF